MITDEKLKYLKVIFSDADILDVDFSKWDDAISVYVVADHVQLPGSQKRTRLAIRFLRVRRFDVSFNHHNFNDFPLKFDQEKHLNWYVYKSDFVLDHVCRITLAGAEQFPVLKIDFEDVAIEQVEAVAFDAVNPGWGNYASGLARPSIEELYVLKIRGSC